MTIHRIWRVRGTTLMERQPDSSDNGDRQPEIRVEVFASPPEGMLPADDAVVIRHAMPDQPELNELHTAIAAKNLKHVKEIIRRGVDVNALHSNYNLGFPITHALSVGDTRIIRVLLEAGADPNRDNYLADFIDENNLPIAKLLVAHGANLVGESPSDDDVESNLIRATRAGRTAFVKLLLEAGADPNLHNANDQSALLLARTAKNRRLVKLLESYVSEDERAWVEERFSGAYAKRIKLDAEIRSAIHVGNIELVVELLESSGRRLDEPLGPTFDYPLEEAIHGYRAMIERTRQRFVDVANLKEVVSDPDYEHPGVRDAMTLIRTLIDLGAPVDKGVYFPPLWTVAVMGDRYAPLLTEMLEKPCDVDAATTMDGDTSLMGAVRSYHVEMTRILLAHGANPNARNFRGTSVLQHTREVEKYNGPNPCIPLLLEAGAKE
jgi:ankyrin repeat protein